MHNQILVLTTNVWLALIDYYLPIGVYLSLVKFWTPIAHALIILVHVQVQVQSQNDIKILAETLISDLPNQTDVSNIENKFGRSRVGALALIMKEVWKN